MPHATAEALAYGPHTTATTLIAADYRRIISLCTALNARVADRTHDHRPDRPDRPDRPERPGQPGQSRHPRSDPHPDQASPSPPPPSRDPADLLDAAALAEDPAALDAFLDAEAVRVRMLHQRTARRYVVASRALHRYAWSVSALLGGAWYLRRRVPRLRLRDVRVDLSTGALVVVPGADFACLPDDPAAKVPGARVREYEEALRAELRAAIAGHLGPLLAALGPHVRRGARALWGLVADDLISAIWHVGRTLGEEEQAVGAATALLPDAIPPFPGGTAFRTLRTPDGALHPTRTRLGCCLHYTIQPAETCLTCPRTKDTERLQRLAPHPEPQK